MSWRSDKPGIVAFPFVGGFVGGSHLSAAKLIQNLDRRRYQPLVVLHRLEGQLADLFVMAALRSSRRPASGSSMVPVCATTSPFC